MYSHTKIAVAAAITCVQLLGCLHDNDGTRWSVDQAATSVRQRFAEGSPLVSEQIKRMLGEPDVRVTARDLYGLLTKNAGAAVASRQIEEIYSRYLYVMHIECQPERWRESVDFCGDEIWVYAWYKPRAVEITGIVPRETGSVWSDYFLVRDGKVIDAAGIIR